MSGINDLAAWINQFPEFIAVLLIAGGWILAHFARRGMTALITRINERSIHWSSRTHPVLSPPFGKFLRQFTFWIILAAFFFLAMSHLGQRSLSGWFDSLWTLSHHILIALAILAAGHILGSLTRNLVSGFSHKFNLLALPRLVYGVIFGMAAVTALGHLGLDVSFITQVILIIFGVFFAGLALAFALGSKALVANLTAQGETRQYKPGDRLMVDDIEGTVVEITRTAVVMSTPQGLVRVPASRFAEAAILLVHAEDGDE